MKEPIRYWGRCAILALASACAVAALSFTGFVKGIELKLGDSLAAFSAPSASFDDVVVIDVDERSMSELEPQIGPWPYDRDVYALVNRYLLQSNVATVAYDILFSEARRGDDEFAATLNKKVVLASASLPYGGTLPSGNYQQRLEDNAWAHAKNWPAQSWQNLTLPLEKFSKPAQVGVISLVPDADGILRRVPLLHFIQGQVDDTANKDAKGEVLPALVTAVLKVLGVPVAIDAVSQRIQIAGVELPQDAQHLVSLRFPQALSLRIIPFYQVALAASGNPKYADLAPSLQGKTVYIGSSSAVLGDFIQTPLGRVAGLYMVAALPSMVKGGMVFHPRNWLVDIGLAAILLALALGVAHPRLQTVNLLQIVTLPGLILLAGAFAVVFNFSGYRVAVVLPALAAVLAHLGALVWRQIHLFKKSQELLVGKLAAEESNRLKSQFLSHMTHELRTPLTAILGFNNINWKSQGIGAAERIQNSSVIERNGRHLLALINSLLDQAKLEAGQVNIVRQSESVRAVVDDIVATLKPLLIGKPVLLVANFAPDMADLFEMDAFRVRQILLNLVGNAIKFTDQGEIGLNVRWSLGFLTIDVTDTGPGLSSAALSRLFIAFQQASDQIAATHGGTGLGLTISQNLANLMQGSITVASEIGVGTCFTLRIPAELGQAPTSPAHAANVGDEPDQAATDAPVMNKPAATLLRGSVLVADDAPDLRALAVLYLKRLGLTVLQAGNGQEAINIALQDHPDAILMDMEMPVLHGLEATKSLRASGFSQPIIAMTAHTGEPYRTLALAAGCNEVIAKPVSYALLRTTLDGALSAPKIDRERNPDNLNL